MSGQTLEEVIPYFEDSVSPLTVLKPASAEIGDLLVLVIAVTDGLLSDITSATWLDEGSPVNIVGQRCKVFSHVVAGGDPSTWDFGYNAGSAATAMLLRYHGSDTTPVVVVTSASTASNGSSMDSPTATPSAADDINVAVHTNAGDGAVALSYLPPAGLADLGKVQCVGNFQAMAAAYVNLSSTTPTGAQTWTSIAPTGRPCGTFTILVKSSGVFDPDPPRNPPPPLLPPWLLRELIAAKVRTLVGSSGEPFVKETLIQGASGVNITLVTQPCEVGDLLVAFHENNWYTAAQLLTPTGGAGTWDKRATGDNGTNNAHVQAWVCPITSAGAKTVTFAPAVDEEHVVHLFVVAGADQASPVDDAAGGNGGASNSHVAPAVAPTSPNDLMLCAAMSTSLTDYTKPPGMDARGPEVDVTSFCTAFAASQTLPGPGSTGTRTFTSSTSAAYATATIAIRPPGAGGGPVTYNADFALNLTAALVAGASTELVLAAVLAVTASLSAGAGLEQTTGAGLAVTASLQAGAERVATPALGLAVTATATAAADRMAAAAATLAATATLTVAGTGDRPAAAALAATATLSVAAARTAVVAAPLAVTATLAAAATRTAIVGVPLAVTATLSMDAVVGTPPIQAAAALAVTATLTTGATLSAAAAANLAVTATLTMAATGTRPAGVVLNLTASAIVALSLGTTTGAVLSLSAALTVAAVRTVTTGAVLAVTATLSLAAIIGGASAPGLLSGAEIRAGSVRGIDLAAAAALTGDDMSVGELS